MTTVKTQPVAALSRGQIGVIAIANAVTIVGTLGVIRMFVPPPCPDCCAAAPATVPPSDTVVVDPGDTVVVTPGDTVIVTPGDTVVVDPGDSTGILMQLRSRTSNNP